MNSSFKTAYLASDDFLTELQQELRSVVSNYENLVLTSQTVQASVWAKCIGENIQVISFDSISQAAKILREAGKYWAFY